VNDWSRETRCSQSMTTRALGVRSSVSVAIRTPAGIWGLLKGSDRQVRDFTEHDANFARGISHLIAAAVERHDVEEQLRRQAVHDPLTGLPNRSLLLDRLTGAFERRDVRPVTLGFVDLDDFSAINNRSGHSVGDQVLAEVAGRLAGQVRHGDTVARIGGDEFIVILEGLNDAEALAIAHRILDAVRHPIHLPGLPHSITVTASIGLAALRDTHQIPEHLIGAADEAAHTTDRATHAGARDRTHARGERADARADAGANETAGGAIAVAVIDHPTPIKSAGDGVEVERGDGVECECGSGHV